VGASSGRHEPGHLRRGGVDQVDAVESHIGHIEQASVRGQLDVVGHAAGLEADNAKDLFAADIHLDQLGAELAAGQQEATVGREV
jgi:hypothetical protein